MVEGYITARGAELREMARQELRRQRGLVPAKRRAAVRGGVGPAKRYMSEWEWDLLLSDMRAMRREGRTVPEIAAVTGYTPRHVARVCAEHRVPLCRD